MFPITCRANLSPNVKAQGAVLIDAETKRILWEKSSDKVLSMASTTKIMTCITALEKGNLSDIVTVSKNAVIAPETKMHLSLGEKLPLEDLLYGLMLESFNDAAIAIAEHISGNTDDFCKLMTEKAHEIGALNTSFETPNGLDSENHYSTAYDMALITAYALENEKFCEIIGTKTINLPINGGNYKSYSLVNKDRFLSEFNGAIGVKTGYTGKAGHCFVGAAKRDDLTLISVVLASGWGNSGKSAKWTDTKSIMNYGFSTFKKHKIFDKNVYIENIPVTKSKKEFFNVKYENDIYAVLSEDEMNNLSYKHEIPEFIEAPVYEGQEIGCINIFLEDELIGTSKILSEENIEKNSILINLRKIMSDWFILN